MELIHQTFALYLKLFFLLTPFFVLGTFITLTDGVDSKLRRKLAMRIALGAMGVTLSIYYAGGVIMKVFGITVDAFRAGSGVLLLLVAIKLVYGDDSAEQQRHKTSAELLRDAVVPLAVPITAGPATLGTLIVMGLEKSTWNEKLATAAAMVMACWTIGLMLFFSGVIVRVLGRTIIAMLGKITGLILSAIAMSMIITGVHALWTAAA